MPTRSAAGERSGRPRRTQRAPNELRRRSVARPVSPDHPAGSALPVPAVLGPAGQGCRWPQLAWGSVTDHLIVRGAREHNLRNVDISLPRDALVVFTGLSGSGKSSLAFDTIFAEGQRRYVESLSAYARQFLGQMDKPDVDFIEGLSPAVSIDQKSTSRNPRSTVGTITEIYDYLRLLFARIGHPHCPICGEPIARQTPQQIVDRVLEMPEGTRFQVLAPVIRERKGEYVDLFADLQSKGYSRARIDGVVHPLTDPPKLKKQEKHSIEVVVDRLVIRPTAKQRITDSVEIGLEARRRRGDPRVRRPRRGRPAAGAPLLGAAGLPERPPARPRRARAAVVLLQLAVRRLPGVHRPRHPQGGRPRAGRARRRAVARARAPSSPGPAGTTSEYFVRLLQGLGASRWASPSTPRGTGCRRAPARRCCSGIDQQVHVTYRNRYGRQRSYYAEFEGVIPFLERRAAQTDSDFAREKYEGYMREVPCPVCHGTRLKPEILAVTLEHGELRPAEHRRAVRDVHQGRRRVLPRAGAVRARPDDRRAGAEGGRRAARASCSTSGSTTCPSTGRPPRCPAARRSGSGWPPRSDPAWSACCTCWTSRRSGCTSGTTTG